MEPTIPSDKLRFGWLGGSSHLHDLGLMRGFTDAIGQEFRDKSQIFICGFDTRGTMTEINAQTGEQKQRDILPQETVWARYEEIFTKNYEFTTPQYKDYLLKFRQEKWTGDEQYYNRVWTEPVTSYAKNYAKFDVSLAPIMNHTFNRVKSQLKVIEAGFYKKAIVASNIGPYTIDLKHSLQNGNFVDGNAILVDEKRNHADWAKAMKKLIQNPTWAADLGERLYETVKDKYDLNIVTDHRAQLYKSLK
jgi:glycosyltransferase involved in cell wall biosynthesis